MRTITVSYSGLEPIEVQLATGKKAIEIKEILKKMVSAKEGQILTEEQEKANVDIACEVIAKCTRFKDIEEVKENLTEIEMMDIFYVIQGDAETIKKVRGLNSLNISN